MAVHNDFGKTGEQISRNYLELHGYEVMDENWCFGKAEIDLIVYKDKQIIFVEVKTRSGNGFGEPEEFVNAAKQMHMAAAATEYIHLMDFKGEIRFDIIAILINKKGDYNLRHIEDAFWPQ